jgi:deazaflavin-dependent oxidoreductase (nitroreductase family)
VSDVRERLAHVADRSTLLLTHHGRRSGTPYEVTIWFLVEGATVYLVTANRERQWVRNITASPAVTFRIGDDTFSGRAEPVTAPAVIDHVTDLIAAKYWYTRPFIWLARLLGRQVSSATFRVPTQ